MTWEMLNEIYTFWQKKHFKININYYISPALTKINVPVKTKQIYTIFSATQT